jgi:hypothetical protein
MPATYLRLARSLARIGWRKNDDSPSWSFICVTISSIVLLRRASSKKNSSSTIGPEKCPQLAPRSPGWRKKEWWLMTRYSMIHSFIRVSPAVFATVVGSQSVLFVSSDRESDDDFSIYLCTCNKGYPLLVRRPRWALACKTTPLGACL